MTVVLVSSWWYQYVSNHLIDKPDCPIYNYLAIQIKPHNPWDTYPSRYKWNWKSTNHIYSQIYICMYIYIYSQKDNIYTSRGFHSHVMVSWLEIINAVSSQLTSCWNLPHLCSLGQRRQTAFSKRCTSRRLPSSALGIWQPNGAMMVRNPGFSCH